MVVDDLIKLLKFKNLEKNLQAKMYERDIEEETEEDQKKMEDLIETYQEIKAQEVLLIERYYYWELGNFVGWRAES